MIRSPLLALLALLPAAAGAAPLLSIEAASALFFRDDPQGSLYDDEFAFGARATVALEPLLSLEKPFLLDAGLLWYGSSTTEGTDATQVSRGLHSFALQLRGGWELGWRPFDALRLAPYLTGGPAVTLTDVGYYISDPVGIRMGLPAQEEGVSGWEWGAVYGAGLSLRAPVSTIELVGRLELLRLHRGPNTDLSLGIGAGLAF